MEHATQNVQLCKHLSAVRPKRNHRFVDNDVLLFVQLQKLAIRVGEMLGCVRSQKHAVLDLQQFLRGNHATTSCGFSSFSRAEATGFSTFMDAPSIIPASII